MKSRAIHLSIVAIEICFLSMTAFAQPVYLTNATKLMVQDGTNDGDWFGNAVSMSGDGQTVLVGTPWEDTEVGEWTGGAYVYSQAAGSWQLQAHLTPDPGTSPNRFAWSVSLSSDGNTALVGDDSPSWPPVLPGSAYVFVRDGSSWTREARLLPPVGGPDDFFGWSVSLSGDGTRALVGSIYHATMGLSKSGSAYVYARSNGLWNWEVELSATDASAGDFFGSAASLNHDGTVALVGAYSGDAAYVFQRTGTNWAEQAKLLVGPGQSYLGYWVSLDADGKTALIGAPVHDSAYVFTNAAGQWHQAAQLEGFAESVSLSHDGTLALIGNGGGSNSNGVSAGIAALFHGSGTNWNQVATLAASDGSATDQFGWALALSGDGSASIVGAWSDDTTTGSEAGSAYAFPLAATFSPEVLNFETLPGSPTHIEFAGGAGCSYDIQATTNLTDWDVLGYSTADAKGLFEFDDPGSSSLDSRFYRAYLR